MALPVIVTVDCDYLRPQFAASYLVHDEKRALFIDNNTSRSVPRLMDALRATGLAPEQVEYLIITHVHLDHAGGSSALMKACPRARLLAHPRAVPHLIDPQRLVRSAEAVYGKEKFAALYGTIEPIEASRVRAVEDGETMLFGAFALRFFFTRGHANHHLCIQLGEGRDSVVFSGDAFGLAYPDLQKSGLFIFPSMSPTDFDAEEARKSVRQIVGTGARAVYLTHFGAVTQLSEAADQLIAALDRGETLLHEARDSSLPDAELHGFCERKLRAQMATALAVQGQVLSGETEELLRLDLELNAAGIAYVARKLRHPEKT